MIELINENIRLVLEEPGEGYQGSRFDWTGKAIQLWWKDISFCTNETKDKIKEQGRGFFNEFGIDDPVGYKECEVGNYFPKIGVGLLKKENNHNYDFFHNYQSIPFEYSEERGEESIIFHCLNKDFDSAFFLEKQFKLHKDGFSIDYLLENVGNRKIETSEYTHNFMALGGKPVTSALKLVFNGCVNKNSIEQGMCANAAYADTEHVIKWKQTPKSDFFFESIAKPKKRVNWTLIDEDLGTGICEIVDFIPAKINLWGREHVVSPEVFKKIKLNPGESDQWQRQYKIIQNIK